MRDLIPRLFLGRETNNICLGKILEVSVATIKVKRYNHNVSYDHHIIRIQLRETFNQN